MASNKANRTRLERVASLKLEPSALSRWLRQLFTGRTMLHVAIAVMAAVLIIVTLRGWQPAFSFREGQIPQRDVVARVAFDMIDTGQTDQNRRQRRRSVLCYYENRPLAVNQMAGVVKNNLSILLDDTPLDELTAEGRAALRDFGIDPDSSKSNEKNNSSAGNKLDAKQALTALRKLFAEPQMLEGGKLDAALKSVLDPIAEKGVLEALAHDSEEGSQRQIHVFLTGAPNDAPVVSVAEVRKSEIEAALPERVSEQFQQAFGVPEAATVGKMVSNYLAKTLPITLSYQKDMSEEARRVAEESVQDATISYIPTVSRLAEAGKPLTRDEELPRLRAEYEQWIAQMASSEVIIRLIAFAGMIVALYLLCGIYIFYQYDPQLLSDTKQLLRLLGLSVITCILCSMLAPDPMRAEIVPLVICSWTMSIAFGRQVALLVTTCLCLTITLGLGLDIGEFVTLCSGTCAAVLLLGRIRTRTKLIYVGAATGAIVALTHTGVDTMLGTLQALPLSADADASWQQLMPGLLSESLRLGGLALIGAALMFLMLPAVEWLFDVQTDLSLLELGDASHQLLRQLAQRAPGTYNHSINVAAIAEAAADSIGAHGLLTRVGAYFHDIGKMFKPNYFVENQDHGGNCHDQLQPAMSTLVIIAHVKDGADLARQHRLPKRIIDFIEQHHGTTLVEYFYREAAKRSAEDPNKEEVSETSFRYPGPKPQSLEAAVLMLADSVESASRTLVEPTSSRIQSLVDQIAMKKLLDGQFDQCGLTLQQLDQLKQSLVKSLTAIYHGRVKYTGQASA